MFLHENLFGISEMGIDKKNRIVVPVFTGVQPKDQLLLLQDDEFFSIYESAYFLDYLFQLYGEKLNHLRYEEPDFWKVKQVYDDIFSRVVASVVVDSQRRIQLPSVVVDYYQLVGLDDANRKYSSSVIVRGCGDHVNVYRDIESMNKIIKSRKLINRN